MCKTERSGNEKAPPRLKRDGALVIPLGLEPRAHTLKVYCSTN